jgi:hypothetical protein
MLVTGTSRHFAPTNRRRPASKRCHDPEPLPAAVMVDKCQLRMGASGCDRRDFSSMQEPGNSLALIERMLLEHCHAC